MSQPKPSGSLDDSCAVIKDNILYVFTPDSFQSLKLKEGAKWENLDKPSESVKGAACTGSTTDFWVVGGTGGSTGLQKFTYSSGKWSTPTPSQDVFKDRQNHNVDYMAATNSLLVIGDSSDAAAGGIMQAYTVDAADYGTKEFNTGIPNSGRPILLNWSDADAVMVGVGSTKAQVFLFNPTVGWRDSGASLADPLTKDMSQVQAALLQGADGSQNLFLFDMSASPNTVSRVVLSDKNGQTVSNSAPVKERSLQGRQTEDDWPKYNSTLASDVTRENFGLAQGSDGMVVLTGGSSKEPLSMFNAKDNEWIDATDFLVKDKKKVKMMSSSTHTSTTATSTSTSSSSTSTTIASTTSETTAATTTDALSGAGASKDDDNNGLGSNTILGITLGSIFAFLLVLALLLFCLRRRKIKRNRAAAAKDAGDGGMVGDEKNPKAFTNTAPTTLPIAAGHLKGHRPQGSADSYSSMAILMGRMNQQKPGVSRKASNDTGRSSIISHHRQFKSTISKPIPQEDSHPILQGQDDKGRSFEPAVAAPRPRNGAAPDPQDGTRRSSGWNRYWSGGSALQLLGFGGAKRNTVASDQSSRYSQASNQNNSRVTQDSATVPPLNFEGRTAMNSVNSGSPVVTGHTGKLPFGEGMSGKIERPSSRGSSGYSSGIPESVNEVWDPTESNKDKPWGSERAPSSAYDSGFNFGQPRAPAAPPSGVSSQPQLAMAATSTDMSWLNLGEQRNGPSHG